MSQFTSQISRCSALSVWLDSNPPSDVILDILCASMSRCVSEAVEGLPAAVARWSNAS